MRKTQLKIIFFILFVASVALGAKYFNDLQVQGNLDVTGTADITGAVTMDALTADTVPYANGSKVLTSSAIDSIELGFLDAVDSALCGITQSCTLTNKTIDADNNTISNLAHGAEVDNPSSGVHGVTGSVVGTTDTQSLTNKTIDADLNTVSNLAHGAEVDNPTSGVHGVTGNVVGTTDTQTLSGKTLTAPDTDIIQWDDQASAPANPSAGFYKTYFKTDGKLYALDSAGTETEIGSGAGSGTGALNILDNPDANTDINNWTGANGTFSRETASPLEGDGSFKFVTDGGSSPANVISDAVTIPTVLKGKNCIAKIRYQTTFGGFNLQIDDGASGVASASLDASVSPQTKDVFVTFVCPESGTLQFEIEDPVNGSAQTITWDLAYLGENDLLGLSSVDTDFESGVCLSSWVTNATIECLYKRIGDEVLVAYEVSTTGVPTSGALTLDLPSGLTIDTAKLVDTSAEYYLNSGGGGLDSGIASYPNWKARYVDNNTFGIVFQVDSASTPASAVLHNSPFAFNTGDKVWIHVKVPVSGWSVEPEKALRADQTDFGWKTGTCTGSWVSNTNYSCTYLRRGENAHIKILVSTTGAPTAANLTVDLPSEIPNIDTAKLLSTVFDEQAFGILKALDSGIAAYPGRIYYSDANTVGAQINNAAATYSISNAVTNAVPFSFGASDSVSFDFIVPIEGWDETMKAPHLVNSVVNPRNGVTRTCSGYIQNNGTATVIRSDGDCISSASRTALGTVTVNFAADTFSDSPNCTVSPRQGSFATIVWPGAGTLDNTTIQVLANRTDINSAVDTDFMIDCKGPTN